MKRYFLVYQAGIANVFRVTKPESEGASFRYERMLQADFRAAENYCRGLLEAGAPVSVWHFDVAGDAVSGPWQYGPGPLFAGNKRPPANAEYADAV